MQSQLTNNKEQSLAGTFAEPQVAALDAARAAASNPDGTGNADGQPKKDGEANVDINQNAGATQEKPEENINKQMNEEKINILLTSNAAKEEAAAPKHSSDESSSSDNDQPDEFRKSAPAPQGADQAKDIEIAGQNIAPAAEEIASKPAAADAD